MRRRREANLPAKTVLLRRKILPQSDRNKMWSNFIHNKVKNLHHYLINRHQVQLKSFNSVHHHHRAKLRLIYNRVKVNNNSVNQYQAVQESRFRKVVLSAKAPIAPEPLLPKLILKKNTQPSPRPNRRSWWRQRM